MKILAKIDEAKDIASKEYIDNLMQSLDSTYQPLISNSNKLAYSLISGIPDLSVYLTTSSASSTYQPKITSSAKLAASLVSGLATVATSGKYSDLSGTPTIPTSLKSPYALSWSGYSSGSYDGSAAKSITIPSNTNQLTNGAGFITSSALSSYLPLSGGTLTGTLYCKEISSPDGYGLLSYLPSNWTGVSSTQWGVGSVGNEGVIRSNNTSLLHYRDGSGAYIIWDSGNDGSGSGLDADMLDGVQLNGLFTSVSSSANTNLSITVGGTTKSITSIYADFAKCFYSPWNNPTSGTFDLNTHYGGGMVRYYGSGGSLTNAPSGFGYGNILSLSTGIASLSGQLAWNINHASTTDTTKALYWRAADSTNGYAYAKWHQIAFTDSNVASATKLQTARTIWGQSFDGTASIGGNITFLADSTYYVGTNSNAAFGVYTAGLWSQSNKPLYIGANNSNHMYISTSGNVGIGTTSPKGKFHVEGNSYLRGTIYVTNPDATTINESSGKIKFNSINADDSYRSPYIQAIYYSSYARKRLGFFQSNAANYTDDFVEVLSILPNGNVGVGTTNPTYKLSVNGSIYINGNLSSNYYYFNDVETNPYLRLLHSGSYWYVQASNGYMYLGVTSVKSCRIDSTGNFLSVGGITSYSDIRKKTKLGDVQLTLKQIADAPLIEHYYKHDDKKTTHVGSIAQYWAGMNDWFCKLDSEGYYTMEIQNAALASAISIARELVKYESKTDRTIRLLKKRINQLEDEIEILKKGA